MSIPDGEYDLDLSVLTEDVSDASSVGLRYQFVPPTVDRNQPVKAYEHGRECILEVPSTDTQKPILFEGTVLKTHPEAHNVASQTYFLSYSEGKPVQLNRLGRTLKVSKTRNASKTESKLQSWMSAKKDSPPDNHTAQNVPDSRPRTASKRASKKPPQKSVQKTVQKSAQEPPKPEDSQDVIIDEADFDSLNSGPEDGFPVIDFDDENSSQVNQKKDNVDDDIDDDFKALEDELAQVMGSPQSEESDADDFPASITTTPFCAYCSMKRDLDDSDSDDDYIGPSLEKSEEDKVYESDESKTNKKNGTDEAVNPDSKRSQKKRRFDVFENTIPPSDWITHSENQESPLTVLANHRGNSLVVGAFKNGTVKFWHKNKSQLDLIKSYVAHPGKAVKVVNLSSDGTRAVSIAEGDMVAKIYDLVTMDMIQSVNLGFVPRNICWYGDTTKRKLMVTTFSNGVPRVVSLDPEEDIQDEVKSMHKSPINHLVFSTKFQCFISSDENGMVEVWDENGSLPTSVGFQYKSQTDLFALKKAKSVASQLALSPNEEYFATISLPDSILRIFSMKSCKVLQEINWVSPTLKFDSYNPTIVFGTDTPILAYTAARGIEFLDIESGVVLKTLGEQDQKEKNIVLDKFVWCSASDMSGLSAEILTSNNTLLNQKLEKNPVVVASATNTSRLFIFGQNGSNSTGSRSPIKPYPSVTLHTTKGDIKLVLFQDKAPRAVENFLSLCRARYYNQVLFHRVIKGFMIQTGDPQGDGTGGDSSFGGDFDDEFHPELSHSQPYMVSMANAGPNTNRSQFFITTTSVPHLDNKHTVFGRVIEGKEVVHAIENVKTDRSDKPKTQITIVSTSIYE
ncbi:Peptidyl-prolyl cis-trans isomerase cyp15 [Meyerozyma sp. JA9]|nr:Peptidyl-prolyl cis-trans isomerase cyp15 [Meyerozyma sp. JA9]